MCCLICWVGLGSGDGSVTEAATLLEDGEGSPCRCTKLFKSPKQPLVQREWDQSACAEDMEHHHLVPSTCSPIRTGLHNPYKTLPSITPPQLTPRGSGTAPPSKCHLPQSQHCHRPFPWKPTFPIFPAPRHQHRSADTGGDGPLGSPCSWPHQGSQGRAQPCEV